jgi:hypothetical protein
MRVDAAGAGPDWTGWDHARDVASALRAVAAIRRRRDIVIVSPPSARSREEHARENAALAQKGLLYVFYMSLTNDLGMESRFGCFPRLATPTIANLNLIEHHGIGEKSVSGFFVTIDSGQRSIWVKIDHTPQKFDWLIALSGAAARTLIGPRGAAVGANPRLEGRAERDPTAGQA